ncbi:MAG TPA: NAD-dependent epimerase/dehydratase family protein [Candidatus Elarobacter sp.]|nr:NAD-dependent epimerase/dehydratase family protein [Candidatus Elarobacter sp.]
MRVLMIGGTVFVGRHIVAALLARGHDVTIFHRGQRGRDVFPSVERILGDRAADLDRLPADAIWDAVVDTCGFVPSIVAKSALMLRERARRYVFISSVSVFDVSQPAIDESSPMPELPDGVSPDEFDMDHYGPLKMLCEREVVAAFGPERALIVRPGLIVGPYDKTDRFTYWPLRFARGGDVLVPDDLDARVQWIDARDLAAFVVDAIERGLSGEVNAVGPAEPATLRDLLGACAAASGNGARLIRVPWPVLKAHGIEGWNDLTVWAPLGEGHDGIAFVDPSRAVALGLRHRPLAQTVADTLRWAQHERGGEPLKAGLTPEREAELLRATSSSSGAR